MRSKNINRRIDEVAAKLLEQLNDMILAMEKASDHVANGEALEQINVGDYPLFMAEGGKKTILCAWSADDYFALIRDVASEFGIRLDEAEEISVQAPEAEFEESMVTGGFMAWKGFSVEKRNIQLEDLLDCICHKLMDCGFSVSCCDEEFVIFQLLVKKPAKIEP
jgi:hypothetical protein